MTITHTLIQDQLSDLRQSLDALNSLFTQFRGYVNSNLEYIKENMLTKQDFEERLESVLESKLEDKLAGHATKDDLHNELARYATKNDLKHELAKYATKNDLKHELAKYATKDDLQSMKDEIITLIKTRLPE